MSDDPEKISFDYIKSNSFRVIHADGIWGGPTPRLDIFMGVWSERPTIPQHAVFSVNADKSLGDEIKEERVSREADAVREMEAGIVMDIGLAKAMVKWLQDKIATLESVAAKVNEKKADDDA